MILRKIEHTNYTYIVYVKYCAKLSCGYMDYSWYGRCFSAQYYLPDLAMMREATVAVPRKLTR